MKNQSDPGTVVGANVKLSGTLKDSSDIVVYGHVEGEVISDQTVTIEENASIKGPVSAKNVMLSGTVRGSIDANEKLELMPSGKLHGSMTTADLIIHSGAVFNGKCTMGKQDDKLPKDETNAKEKVIKETEEIFGELEAEIE